jgi:hypothetical protein
LTDDEIDRLMKEAKKQKQKEADFSVACPQCHKVKVNGSQIRKINNAHHVIIGHDIDDQVTALIYTQFKLIICSCCHWLWQLPISVEDGIVSCEN